LKREGFAVDTAADGEEGLYHGREVPFDIAVIDLGLPKMSGMDLVKALREAGQRFPILILTARSSWQDKVEGLKAGADDYLVKRSGMDLAKGLRTAGRRYPSRSLTARSSWQDKVEGLNAGADDYLVKPFHVEELLARMNALLRRAAGWSKPILDCGPVRLDL